MARVSALSDVDPLFAEISKHLFGDAVDPRELWDISKNTDAADVHTDRSISKPKKPKQPGQSKGHTALAAGLALGAAAEGLGTVRAGQEAVRAVRAGKLVSRGTRAAKVGEFGLQSANLGIGLTAAHALGGKPKDQKPAQAIGKAAPKLAFLRPVQSVMTDAQAARHTAAVSRGGQRGALMVTGAAAGLGAGVGHHLGRRSGRKLAATAPIGKALVPPASAAGLRPLARGVRTANSGGAGRGLGRHGRPLGGNGLPAPRPTVAKSADVTWRGEISKVDTDKRQVFGFCSISEINGEPVVDLQGDYIPIDEIEKSAYTYVIESRKGGDMHRRVAKFAGSEPHHTADMIESFVVTPEKLTAMGLPGDSLPLGWWIGFKVNDDEQWNLVKSKGRTAFSIHGSGVRESVTL